MEFRILGPLEVEHDGAAVPLGSRKQRAVLAILLLRANEVVPADTLVDELWGDQAPPSAWHTLQAYVSRLRATFRAAGVDGGILLTQPPGYVLRIGFGELDLARFEQLADEGRRALDAGANADAAATLRRALGLWRGPPLADLTFEPFARVDVERLAERRLVTLEDRIEADLALGRHDTLGAELEALVAQHPLRERLRGQQMLALYRAGRQADALAAYRHAHAYLSGELGVDPSRKLQALEQAILRHDESLDLDELAVEHARLATLTAAPPPPADPEPPEPEAPLPPDPPPPTRLVASAVLAVVAALAGLAALLLHDHDDAAPPPRPFPVRANAVVYADAATLRPLVQQDTGGRPAGAAAGAGSVWVSDAANDRVLRLDATTHRIVDRIPVGREPGALVATREGIWVVDTSGSSVSQIDPASGTVVATVPVGNAPVAIAASAGAVWVADADDGTLTRIDPSTARRVATVDLGWPIDGLAAGDGSVWATSAASGLLLRVDARRNRPVQSIAVGNGPAAVALAGGAVWVANPPDGTLSRVDPGTGAVRKVPVADPGALAATPDALWVARGSRLDVARLDPHSGRLLGRIRLGAPAAAIAARGRGVTIASLASPTAHRGGTLRISGGQGVYSVDPGEVYSSSGWAVVSQVYDGLVTYARRPGPAGAAIVPDLAASLPVVRDDGLTYTFRLRPGIRYSTGRRVRAADVRRSLERQYRAGTGLGRLGVPLRGADACTRQVCDLRAGVVTDEAARTITLRLSRPDPQLLQWLALPFGAVVPAGSPAIGSHRAPLPGTGPYRIARFRADRTVVLVRNRSFRAWDDDAQPAGYPDRLVFSLGLGADRQRAAVEAGKADIALDSPPANAVARLTRQRPLTLHRYAVPLTVGLFLNVTRPPFDREDARRAVALAVDRRAAVAAAGGAELARPTCQTLPPTFPGYRPFCPFTRHPDVTGVWHGADLARARALVRASGTAGAAVRLLAIASDAPKLAMARQARRVLEQLGYRAALRTYPDAHAYYAALNRPETRAQIGVFAWAADYPAGAAFFAPLFTCSQTGADGLNASELCDRTLDRAIARATGLQTRNAAAANAAWQAIDRDVSGRAAWVPLVNPVGVDLLSDRVGNYLRNPAFGVLLDRLWVR